MKNLTYHTSKYSTFKIYEPKERLIFRLPYYPDRITHHAIMNITVLNDNKEFLRTVLLSMKLYLRNVLKLELKQNYQIFPVNSRGIDFVGYKFFHTHVLLGKSIKVRLFKLIKGYKDKKIDRNELRRRMQSYFGWLKFCNSKNLLHKIQSQLCI